MVFYFSATGNSRYVAQRVAQALDTQVKDITACLQSGELEYRFAEGEAVGIVAPVYFWGLPENVKSFLERVSLDINGYFFYISTYGTTPGASGKMADRCLKDGTKRIDGMFSVKMPDTWTPIFDLSDKAAVRRTNEQADKEIKAVIGRIGRQEKTVHMRRAAPLFVAHLVHLAYNWGRRTSCFSVEDSCVGCGLCAKKCPVEAIRMENGKPVWTKAHCVMCLGCLHRCPKFSIQYGSHTKRHGQYRHPNGG